MENSDVNQQSEVFYKYRGATRCLSVGISFLTDNFLAIVKLSLPYALTFAAILTAIVYITSDSSFMDTMMRMSIDGNRTGIILVVVLSLLYVLLFVAEVMYEGFIFRLVHIRSHNLPLSRFTPKAIWKSSLKYAGKAFWFYLVTVIIVQICSMIAVLPFVFGGEGTIFEVLKIGVFAVVMSLTLIFALPLSVALPAMFLEKGKARRNAFYGYRKGLRIWGKVFCLSILIAILQLFLIFVLSMPFVTMVSSYHAATQSQLYGDAVHLPGGFGVWYAICLFVTSYLYTFLLWLQTVPFAYLYASIKSDEIEEAKNQYVNS